jgi:hypothetical protein
MGAHFAKPALAAGSYTFTASGGGITTIQHMISIPAKGALTVTNPAADKLTLTLSQTTGTYSGSFLPAGAKARTAFSGVVYQKEATQSGGVFPGETTTGVISFP